MTASIASAASICPRGVGAYHRRGAAKAKAAAARRVRASHSVVTRAMAGPTYEQLIDAVVNPPSTPALNIWRITAFTNVQYGRETDVNDGFVIYPELTKASVTHSNPGTGLYGSFTFTIGTLTTIPAGGTILLSAPRKDFYTYNEKLQLTETSA